MASQAELGAILTAMVTPFGADGRLNEEATRRLARHLVDHGSDGIVLAGTTGESPTLSEHERLRLLEVVLEEVGGDATVVMGTGSNSTEHAINLTEQASAHGADAVLVVTPYYNKPNRRGLLVHFQAVARSTEKPVMLYNIPSRCVINLEPELLGELAEIENVVALKQSNADMEQARKIVSDGRLALYAGDDNMIRAFAEIGGAGGVSVAAHLLGDQIKELYEAASEGDAERAREIDEALQDVYETLFMTSSPIPIKAALNLLGFDVGGLRLPLVEASDEERRAVAAMLDRHGLAAPAVRE